MKTIGFYSIKGGVGKTAACVNMSYLAACDKKRTLLSDLDPQGSATFYYRIRTPKKYTNKTFMNDNKKRDNAIKATDFNYLDVLPSDLSYRHMDISLDKHKHSRRRIKTIYQKYNKEYDYIFVDCPPNITLVSENVFRAVDILLVPVIPTTLSMMTFETLHTFFKDKKLPRKKLVGFYSMVDRRKKLHNSIIEENTKSDYLFLNTVIPYLSDVEKMGISRQPLTFQKPVSIAAKAYNALWDEVKNLI